METDSSSEIGQNPTQSSDRTLESSEFLPPAIENQLQYENGYVIGERYSIQQKLGKGGFGAVYAALDVALNRMVAIKRSNGLRTFIDGRIRDEARAIASLNHPNIVQVHDLLQISDDEVVIVMEYLEGITLGKFLRQSKVEMAGAVEIALQILDALIHAHERKLVHSDLKPENLFVTKNRQIKLLDFGLALAYFPEEEPSGIGGTPGYMSPEQIRGESHLIDGRTDIWAFGIILFEMLTGSRPFAKHELKRVANFQKLAPPPRQLNSEIDEELQRITLKCLAPLIKDRYRSATELKEDLDAWHSGQSLEKTEIVAVDSADFSASDSTSSLRLSLNGLQPFTERDSKTYFSLIPGPKDRHGVPDSIRFWMRWIESSDPELEYPVGILYGPSGSGKTSYVRAGLLQQLSPHICKVYVECRPGDLAGRITRIIEGQLHSDSGDSSLRDLLLRFRSGRSGDSQDQFHKLLIVLDQFEAWAHSASTSQRADLAEALRQCDGIQIRALVVTREDYWSGVKELLNLIEVPIQEGRNAASINLMDKRQAKEILEALGRDLGTLPPINEALTPEQESFLKQAVDEIATHDAVICVHLVMFAQMIKLQQWSPKSLRTSGGVAGACGMFFSDLFEGSGRNSPEYQRVAMAANVILEALLPEVGGTVAATSATHEELLNRATQSNVAYLLDDCLELLVQDLRILTIFKSDPSESNQSAHRYRLAHDFLIEPIQYYLNRRNQSSWRGRAKSRLRELSDSWSKRPSQNLLPGLFDYFAILFGAGFRKRSAEESNFLHAATRKHSGRISLILISAIAFIALSYLTWSSLITANRARTAELAVKVDFLFHGPHETIPNTIEELRDSPSETLERIRSSTDSVDHLTRFKANLYLESTQPATFAGLSGDLDHASPDLFDPLLAAAESSPDAMQVLTEAAEDANELKANRAILLLAYLGDESALLDRLAGSIDARADTAFLTECATWGRNPDLWLKIVTSDALSRVRYHAAIVLTTYSKTTIQQAKTPIDCSTMIGDPDAVICSLGLYLAHHIGVDARAMALNPPTGSNWTVGPDRIPMLRFEPARVRFEKVSTGYSPTGGMNELEVKRPFWLASIPVTQSLYAEFEAAQATTDDGSESAVLLDDNIEIPEYLIGLSQPMLGTNLAQAYSFCNWLSRREGLQEVYTPREVEQEEFSTRDKYVPEPVPWTFNEEANGYRLPTSTEFRLAAQANYEVGYAWNTVLNLPRESNLELSRTVFPPPIFHRAPSCQGIFQIGAGTWCSIDGADAFTSLAIFQYGFHGGFRTTQIGAPSCTIFLARNAAP